MIMKHLLYNIVLYDYLNGKHKDIIHDMLIDEFYILQDKEYDIVYLITYYGKVVGFLASNFNEDGEILFCEICYIQKDYRSLGLFCHALGVMDSLFDVNIILDIPNSFTVKSLIFNNYAFMLNDYLILSKYHFSYYNRVLEKVCFSRLYDLRNCGIIDLENKIMSPLMDVDARINEIEREVINDEYFDRVLEDLFLSLKGGLLS